MYEIDAFTPIVNLPQCAILGVGRIVARPVVVDEATEQVAVRRMLSLSLTFDHRLVDGAPAARFLQRIKHLVERPTLWLFRSKTSPGEHGLTEPARRAGQTAAMLALYRQMLIIRRTEEQLARAHQQGLVHGACHTYVGEEAIAVGVCAHLRADDAVFSTHRGHGHALAKGVRRAN